jgi:periplasmic divalent cation tolerance protein
VSAAARGASVVLVTAASEEQAVSIARALIGERLAACVNIVGPIRSIYRWRGEVQDDREQLMIIKTRSSLVSKIERRVRQLHSYEVPEVIAVPIAGGSKPYLEWLRDSATPLERGVVGKKRR